MKKHCMMIAAALAVANAAAADAPKGGVMAYAEIETTVLTVQNTATNSVPVKYVSAYELAGYKVTHNVGDVVDMMPMHATWQYGTNRLGVGNTVELRAAAGTTNRVVAVSVEPVVLVHAQVYDYFGYDPTTANPTAYAAGNAAHTKEFTELDKRLVARYLEAYGLAGGDDRKKLWLDPASPDTDADGLPDGWELYVMFGREGVTETLAIAKISPYNYSDARALAPSGDMTVLEKWNGGAPAYDPWRTDTNGNGVSDVDEIAYRLDDPYGDADGDGLSNVAEWLVGSVFTNFPGTAGISATNAYSLTALMPDYYRRVENLYLGEMFADHDFMEDGWEDKYKATARSLYDPWNDPDGDGWSNYAECRAGTDPGDAASRPAPTIRASVSMAPGEGAIAGKVVFEAYGTEPIDPAGRAEARWTVETGGVTRAAFRIDGRGVRGGRHVFAAWFDKNGDGKWDPGEPYGAAKGVDVGWSDAEFTVELTQTTPIMARIDLTKAIGDSFATANAATDRGNVNTINGYYANEPCRNENASTNMPANANSLTRVRVVRSEINGIARNPYTDIVLDRYLDLLVHPTLTEADLIADGEFDLERGRLRATLPDGWEGVTGVTYRVVIGDGEVGTNEATAKGKNLPVLFINRFEDNRYQSPTVPITNYTAQLIYPSRPTFCWSHTNTINKAYPAFQLRIYKEDKQTIVYDSGAQRAPARDQNGMYEWTAPVYAGMATIWETNGVKHTTMFTTTNNYYWSVSMIDGKFTEFNDNEKENLGPVEEKIPFRLGTSGSFADGHGHGSIAVRVKYFGALYGSVSMNPTSMAGVTNLVRVQAFTTPDFTGLPVAETYVTNVATIASESVIATNAVLRGVAPGTYYVRAYIDTDADGVKSDWESWGYNCYVGDRSVERAWAPKPITLKCNLNPPPDATVFIEDADTDNDGFPDAWEWNQYGDLATQGPVTGNTAFPTVNPSLSPTLNN